MREPVSFYRLLGCGAMRLWLVLFRQVHLDTTTIEYQGGAGTSSSTSSSP